MLIVDTVMEDVDEVNSVTSVIVVLMSVDVIVSNEMITLRDVLVVVKLSVVVVCRSVE